MVQAVDTLRERKSSRRVGPYMVPRAMSSTNSATLATPFGIKGVNYSISSACSTSAHCIGNGTELIQWGKQDIVRSEEHTSELQSLMRNSYAVFCLKQKRNIEYRSNKDT